MGIALQANSACIDENAAALTIQNAWRAYASRSTYPNYSFEIALRMIAERSFEQLPQAVGGKATVYLLPRAVIKVTNSSNRSIKTRLKRLELCAEIANFLGLKHLFIPEADRVNGYIIEERAPVSPLVNQNFFGPFALYLDNALAFNEAVEDFTRLFLFSEFKFVTSSHPIIRRIKIGRYDNIIPYLDHEGRGKLALVDLERFHGKRENIDKSILPQILKDLVHLFPAHVPLIVAIVRETHFLKETNEFKLQRIAERHLQFFSKTFIKHQIFFKIHGITARNPKTPLLEFNLVSNVEAALRKWMSIKSAKRQDVLIEVAPLILDFLQSEITSKLTQAGNVYELHSTRSFIFKLKAIRSILPENLINSLKKRKLGNYFLIQLLKFLRDKHYIAYHYLTENKLYLAI